MLKLTVWLLCWRICLLISGCSLLLLVSTKALFVFVLTVGLCLYLLLWLWRVSCCLMWYWKTQTHTFGSCLCSDTLITLCTTMTEILLFIEMNLCSFFIAVLMINIISKCFFSLCSSAGLSLFYLCCLFNVVIWICWVSLLFVMVISSIPKRHSSLWSIHPFLFIEFVLIGMNCQTDCSFLAIGFYCLHPSMHCLFILTVG